MDNFGALLACERAYLDDDREGWSGSDYEKAEEHLLESTCEKCGKEEFRVSESDSDIVVCGNCGNEINLPDWMNENPDFFEYDPELNIDEFD